MFSNRFGSNDLSSIEVIRKMKLVMMNFGDTWVEKK